jgi:hypothetical protein
LSWVLYWVWKCEMPDRMPVMVLIMVLIMVPAGSDEVRGSTLSEHLQASDMLAGYKGA